MSLNTPRKLGFWESIREFVHEQKAGTSLIVTVSTIVGSLSPELVKQVLFLLYTRHLLLQAHVKKTDTAYFFEFENDFSQIPINIFKRKNDKQWREVVTQELATPLKTDKYVWRATFLYNQHNNQHELIVAFHHALADGFSVIYFAKDFLQYCQRLIKGEDLRIQPLPLLPPAETLLPKKISWQQFVENAKQEENLPADVHWRYRATKPMGERLTKQIYYQLNANTLSQLRKLCQANAVSINSALSAAILIAGFKQKIHSGNLSLLTLVDLRKYCAPEIARDHFGCYVSSVLTRHQLVENINFWQLAKECQQKIQQAIKTSAFPPAEFQLKDALQYSIADPGAKLTEEKKSSGFAVDFCITNLGYLDLGKDYKPFEWKNFYFGTSRQAGDIGLIISTYTMQNTMFFAFGYTEPLVEKELIEKIINEFVALLSS